MAVAVAATVAVGAAVGLGASVGLGTSTGLVGAGATVGTAGGAPQAASSVPLMMSKVNVKLAKILLDINPLIGHLL